MMTDPAAVTQRTGVDLLLTMGLIGAVRATARSPFLAFFQLDLGLLQLSPETLVSVMPTVALWVACFEMEPGAVA